MSYQTIPDTDIQYGLICFDAEGRERREPLDLMSDSITKRVIADCITDVFFFCHGWQGDVPAAIRQYDKWLKSFATANGRNRATRIFAGFRPFLIGLHWPSLPFGDEEISGGSFGLNGVSVDGDTLLESYLERLGGAPEIRTPLEIIFAEALRNSSPEELPENVSQAYLELNSLLGLRSDGIRAPPDADRQEFDPRRAYQTGINQVSFGGGFQFGGVLGPLRQLSYWTMKKRARTIGEGGLHDFLKTLQEATVNQKTHIHLMGHSFGTIVVSCMIGGPNVRGLLPRPVDSLALIQGAVSLWCYASDIPFANAGAGYFNPIIAARKVRGPIITTQSRFDYAVGRFYPLASRLKGSASFAGELPEFGAIGTYGIQGLPTNTCVELTMNSSEEPYRFEPGKIYNINASQFICHTEGVSGAHSDIAGPEVAHAIWAAALTRGAAVAMP